MLELIAGESTASSLADSRMHRAGVFAAFGVSSLVFFFLLALWLAPTSYETGCGLGVAVLAALIFPAAAAAFVGGICLSLAAIVADAKLMTPLNLLVTVVNSAGALVFGFFLFAMFFGQVLVP